MPWMLFGGLKSRLCQAGDMSRRKTTPWRVLVANGPCAWCAFATPVTRHWVKQIFAWGAEQSQGRKIHVSRQGGTTCLLISEKWTPASPRCLGKQHRKVVLFLPVIGSDLPVPHSGLLTQPWRRGALPTLSLQCPSRLQLVLKLGLVWLAQAVVWAVGRVLQLVAAV